MYNVLTKKNDPVIIGNLEVEVTLEENHEYKNSVTKFKVEEGFDITDNVHQELDSLTIDGVYSDTPLPFRDGQLSPLITGIGENRTQKAIEELLKICGRILPKQDKVTGIEERGIDPKKTVITPETHINPQIVDIVSGLRIYTNMVCTSLKFRKDRTSGFSLPFSMTFKKISTITSEIAAIDKVDSLGGKAPNIENQGPDTKAAGTQTTKKPTSVFSIIYESLKTTWGGG